ncbi:terpene synthase family protein [Micromonospora sp. PSH03]|uniref:terpene synthase family protein n=1 Tax=Micromonospora TaxID=1873 RepID=UPI001EE8A0B4|nr:terpene synthase family protein [Micromonospora salmantinae]MCG5454431.1 terpene synthase family protein [Micromonospora salmantinae]
MTETPRPARAGQDAVAEQGRVCALAVRGVRDLQDVTAAHPELFDAAPFDPAMLSSVATAIAFTAPWHTAAELRITTRTLLWVFAADWQVDYLARSVDDVRHVVNDCLAVADGAVPPPGRHLARLLADLRDELATVPAFARLRPIWRDELARMLAAVAREWDWKHLPTDPTTGRRLPDLNRYLDNADNLACSFVNVTHWIATGDEKTLAQLTDLLDAGRGVQRVLRLVNDLATQKRDAEWGDLNALSLVDDPAQVHDRLAELTARSRGDLAALAERCPRQADYLNRQISFTGGFYQLSDFWGARDE